VVPEGEEWRVGGGIDCRGGGRGLIVIRVGGSKKGVGVYKGGCVYMHE